MVEVTRATGGVVLLDGNESGMTIASARGQMEKLGVDEFTGGETLARSCIENGTCMRSDAAITDDRICGDARRVNALHSLIAAPLSYGDSVLGVLEVCSSVSQAFDDIDAQAVSLIANAMGGALGRQLALEENARLLRRLHDALIDTQATAQMYQDAASLDVLTGLPNRAAFETQLEAICEAHDGQPHRLRPAVPRPRRLQADQRHLRPCDGRRGAARGGARAARDAARHGRGGALGGDEFVVLLNSLRDADRDVRSVAEAVEDELARPRVINGVRFRIHCSVGWVIHDGVAHAGQILHAADARMYEQKRARRRR